MVRTTRTGGEFGGEKKKLPSCTDLVGECAEHARVPLGLGVAAAQAVAVVVARGATIKAVISVQFLEVTLVEASVVQQLLAAKAKQYRGFPGNIALVGKYHTE